MMEPNACCANCGRMLTTRATWSYAVGNAGARLLGRLHDEGQVMNDDTKTTKRSKTPALDMGLCFQKKSKGSTTWTTWQLPLDEESPTIEVMNDVPAKGNTKSVFTM